MSATVKAALTYGLPTAGAVALLELVAGVGLTGSPVVDGLICGAGVTLLTIGIYKNKVDAMERELAAKADKSAVAEMREDLREIRRHLMGDK